jgi:F-type H+-transporting ATPase subunit a
MILHHIGDSHDWHLFDLTDANGGLHPVSIPLPVILYTDGNLDIFLSSEFHHGMAQVTKGDRTYANEHEHIIEVSGKKVLDFSITKNVASMFLAVTILLLVFTSAAGAYGKRRGQAPKGLQSFVEPLIVFVRDEIAMPNIGEKKYSKYMPYLLTVFFFIWINNMLGLVPTGANASGNIAFTMTLAVITGLITNLSGNAGYWGHIFWTPGVPLWLRPIMLPVEVVGILTKPFALMIRLFANITAGHIIILSLLSFIFIFKSIAVGIPAAAFVIIMTFMELFVAALQAYIFTLLSALFIGTAVEEHHHDDHH